MTQEYTHDAIVIGAGIAGSAMALALANQGLRIALIDKQAPKVPTHTLGLRVSSIHLGSERFLETMGVSLNAHRRGIFKQIEVFQENSFNTLTFAAQTLDLPYLGSIIENDVLIDALQSALAQSKRVSCYWPAVLHNMQITPHAVTLNIQGKPTLIAPLVIGADGAHSWLRAQCGIVQEEKSYQQRALVAHVLVARGHNQIAYQRFLNTGPLAFLPLQAPHACSIVWSSTPKHIESLANLDEAQLAEEITRSFSHLGKVELMSAPAHFPLMMRHAKRYIAPRIALVGDAIHTLHPLAGQGANLGLMDVACLASTLLGAQDKGDMAILRRYERSRRGANVLMLQAMQWLAKNQQPMPQLRSFLMRTVNGAPLLQQVIMRYALGLDYD
jgi:2-polyprenylphenol 6-hydroxylase